MTLTLTDDQIMIREEATRFLADRASRTHIRHFIEAGGGTDAKLWASLSQELGWAAMAIAEEQGGLGLGATEQLLLLEETGASLAPVPLWSNSCLAAPLLQRLGSPRAHEILEAIASGEASVTLALPDIGAQNGGLGQINAQQSAEGFALSGKITAVIDAKAADILLLPVNLGGEIAVLELSAAQLSLTDQPCLDATRSLSALSLEGLRLPLEARLDQGGVTAQDWDYCLDYARLGLAAEQIGTAKAVMDITLDYISERVQFGRLIASYQAIKHRCALLQVDLAEARSLAYGVADGFADRSPEDRGMEVAALKAMADDLAQKACREAIQMHGGVAMTWEYDPHFYFKRAQVSASLLGIAAVYYESIAADLLGPMGGKHG